MRILVLNSGGSSLKFRLYEMPGESVVASGAIDRLGSPEASFKCQVAGQEASFVRGEVPDLLAGLRLVLTSLRELGPPEAVAHKLPHGGEEATGSVRIDQRVKEALTRLAAVVPVHNGPVLSAIEAVEAALPSVPQYGTFETHFHASLSPAAWRYCVPEAWYTEHGIRRYGFHSCSHRYVAGRVSDLLGRPLAELRTIICHLGSGTSVCGVVGGRSVEISSGFTPQSGTPMSTRSGDIDPFVVTYLLENTSSTAVDINRDLTRSAGLAALSGVGGDMRDIRAAQRAGDDRAQLAIEVFVWNIRRWIGACLMATSGVDALAFTGGIGENDPQLREEVCAGLDWLGVNLDASRNAERDEGLVSHDDSAVAVLAVRTDEEIVVARDAYRLAQD